MAKRLKELIVDKDGKFREHSGKRVEVVPVGYPIGLAIPHDCRFDKRKTAIYIKNSIRVYQPSEEYLPGISFKEPTGKHISSSDVSERIDYYLVNSYGQPSGTDVFNRWLKTSNVTILDARAGGATLVEGESNHDLGAIQFYRQK